MKSQRKPRPGWDRQGVITVLAAMMMILMVGMVAFGVDLGYILNTRTELQSAVDSAAFAGAGALVNGTDAAYIAATTFFGANVVGGKTLTAGNATVDFGNWDTTARTFTATNTNPNAVRVTGRNTQQPLFFARIFGKGNFDTQTSAVATYQPRDIALVLDYSASMCYDSQFRNLSLLGQAEIETNLQQIYTQLGSPTYGALTFAPAAYGTSSTSTNTVISHFNLTNVAYPYPHGSWSEYVSYVQTDSYINAAGYRNKYGYLTYVNYLLAKHPTSPDTPGLYNVSEQPVTALKDAVTAFLDYLTRNSADDRVSLSLYTYTDGTAVLENTLTRDLSIIANISRTRQAGHYISGTNISAGMAKGRADLVANARLGVKKMLVLMTDGVVNLPTGNTTSDKNLVLQEANTCAGLGIPILTIALGAYADTALMQQVATTTGGVAFVVPGGQPISAVQAQLEAVFAQVAADRPLKLVK
jgi:hypothetical protein